MSDLFHPDVPDQFIAAVFSIVARGSWHTFQILTKRPLRQAKFLDAYDYAGHPLPNVWYGVSAEDQSHYDERMAFLDNVNSPVNFVSLEPLLGPIDIRTATVMPDWVIVGGESGPHARPCYIEWVRSIRDQCQRLGIPFFFKGWGGRWPNEFGRTLDGKEWLEYPQRAKGVTRMAGYLLVAVAVQDALDRLKHKIDHLAREGNELEATRAAEYYRRLKSELLELLGDEAR